MIERLARHLWQRLRQRHPRVCAATPHPASASAPDDERPLGCGWFDSSHELQQGLVVQEHAGVDALGAELPLNAWLALCLAGPQGRMQRQGGTRLGQA